MSYFLIRTLLLIVIFPYKDFVINCHISLKGLLLIVIFPHKDFAWRKKVGADTILEDYEIPDILKKYLTGGQCGEDKEGCPIWVDPYGRVDMKGLISCQFTFRALSLTFNLFLFIR